MKKITLVCEGTEREDLIAVSVKSGSSDEEWFCNKVIPEMVKEGVIVHLGVLFGETDNKYLLTPEDYERVKPLIDKRKVKKEIAMCAAECVGSVIGGLAIYYILEAIRNR